MCVLLLLTQIVPACVSLSNNNDSLSSLAALATLSSLRECSFAGLFTFEVYRGLWSVSNATVPRPLLPHRHCTAMSKRDSSGRDQANTSFVRQIHSTKVTGAAFGITLPKDKEKSLGNYFKFKIGQTYTRLLGIFLPVSATQTISFLLFQCLTHEFLDFIYFSRIHMLLFRN